jgi:hypothetical protein
VIGVELKSLEVRGGGSASPHTYAAVTDTFLTPFVQYLETSSQKSVNFTDKTTLLQT